ncbi:MAG: pyridoxal phosphate-dependent aminotransferase [Bacteroidales bacterium]|nr:pyridoxal phosphate-dependent aminotransferase [Bacteroidales bacterium]
MYDFDELVDRRGTDCLKYDRLGQIFGKEDLASFWIADMDFKTPDFIRDAMRRRLDHPIYGYTAVPDDYFQTISEWIGKTHGWKVDPSHIRYIPGIVKGIAFAERCFLNPGDKVVIMPPVYHPFRNTTVACGFEVVQSPLVPVYDENGFLTTYEVDFEDFEHVCADPAVKLFVMSSPHNPCGIVWPEETLRRIAEITRRNGVLVISDEIHAEMVLDGCKHIPFAAVSEDAAMNSIVFMAPSKTFNIAGIVSSYCIVENERLRERFFAYLCSCEIDSPGIFSIEATLAAYRYGAPWRREMLAYVKNNINFVDSWLRENLPSVRAVRPQASFLIWLDCRKLGITHDELIDLFVNKAGIALNDGAMFGESGSGFMRFNVGCPRVLLEDALARLKNAVLH